MTRVCVAEFAGAGTRHSMLDLSGKMLFHLTTTLLVLTVGSGLVPVDYNGTSGTGGKQLALVGP